MEKIKNVLAVCLVFSMLLLTYLSLTVGAGEKQNQFAVLIKEFFMGETLLSGNVEGSGIGAYPRAISVVNAGKIYTDSTTTSASEIYKDTEQFYYEAIGSLNETTAISEGDYIKMLKENCIIIDYSGRIPLYLLKLWANTESEEEEAYPISHIVLHQNGKDIELVFRDESDGRYYVSETAADVGGMHEILAKYTQNNAVFATSDIKYNSLTQDTIIEINAKKMKQYKVQNLEGLSADREKELLTAIDMNPYLANSYQENDGSKVYVNSGDVLRIAKDGQVVFTGRENGIAVSTQKNIASQKILIAESISKMREIYSAVGYNSLVDVTLSSIELKGDEINIFFNTTIDGAVLKSDMGNGQMRMTNGIMNYFSFSIPCYEIAGETTLLPQTQGVLAVAPNELTRHKIETIYVEEKDLIVPVLGYYKEK